MDAQRGNREIPPFDRRFLSSGHRITRIGGGAHGGKASGLIRADDILSRRMDRDLFPEVDIDVPLLVILGTDVFDAFMDRNDLHETALSDRREDVIFHAFQRAELPAEVVGDLRSLVEEMRRPLAVRSSSLLEDALYRPLAGVYATKMTPNNQPDPAARYRALLEAIRFVYASVFSRAARDYLKAMGKSPRDEKMAVIIQEIVGTSREDRFYPHISGVARSFSFYPSPSSRPEDGVVSLALGLGKTIVDGGVCWSYSPARPTAPPPFADPADRLRGTQREFWAVNLGRPPSYDPVREAEYLVQADLAAAERDGTLQELASTYVGASDRFMPGTGRSGPRALDFAPILQLRTRPINDLVRRVVSVFEEEMEAEVEIEFAVTLPDPPRTERTRFGFLQVRPMVVSDEPVEIAEEDMTGNGVLASSRSVMGNGIVGAIQDIVYVRPEHFTPGATRAIAGELESINALLVDEQSFFALIGFGRWGSSDPWLGIPVAWGQISGARVIVEATLPNMLVDPSQGSHFFHNISSFRVGYLFVRHQADPPIDWSRLDAMPAVTETEHVRHVHLDKPLDIRLDGRSSRGILRLATPASRVPA